MILSSISSPALIACLILGAAACSSPTGETKAEGTGSGFGPGITIDEALKSRLSGPLLVNGWLLVSPSGESKLCSRLTDSMPPGCAAPSLLVRGLDLKTVENLRQEGGLTWSETSIQLLGEVKSGELHIKAGSRG